MMRKALVALGVVIVLALAGVVLWLRPPHATLLPSTQSPAPVKAESTVARPALVTDTPPNTDDAPVAGRTPMSVEAARRAGSIRGNVVDEGNVPVPEVEVALEGIARSREDAREEEYDLQISAHADASGAFEFQNLASGAYMLEASRGDTVAESMVVLYPGAQNAAVTLVMRPTGTIAGHVVDADGNAVANAMVIPKTWKDADGNLSVFPLPANDASVDASGRFELTGLWHGQWQLVAISEGYAPVETDFIGVGEKAARIVLKMKEAKVVGVVLDAETGNPVEGVEVTASAKDSFLDVDSATTDQGGKYILKGLGPGTYTLKAPMSKKVKVVAVAGKETAAPVLKVSRGATVSGRVYDAQTGQGIKGAEIQGSLENGDIVRSATTDTEGKYILAGLEPGLNWIERNTTPGYPPGRYQDSKSLEVSAGKRVTGIDFACQKGVSIRGTVIDDGNRPIAGARVRSWQNGPVNEVVSDADGAFSINNCIPDESAFLLATKDGLSSEPVGPIVPSGDDAEGIRLKLLPSGSISGIVVDLSGNPVAGALVEAELESPPYVHDGLRARCDSQGRFQLKNLAPRTYVLGTKQALRERRGLVGAAVGALSVAGMLVEDDDDLRPVKGQLRIAVSPGAEIADVRLVLGGNDLAISGHITMEDGTPVSGAHVMASASVENRGYAESDEEGNYRVEGLSEGSYDLSIRFKDVTLRYHSRVAAGANDADFVFPLLCSVEGAVTSRVTGKPIGAFQVTCNRAPQVSEEGVYEYSNEDSHTRKVDDPGGIFKMDNVEPGDMALTVEAPGFTSASVPLQLAPGQRVQGLVVQMDYSAPILGSVTDEAGQPVPGASIVEMGQASTTLSVKTRADGSFELTCYSPDISSIYVSHPDFPTVYVDIDPAQAARGPLKIVLSRGGAVEGYVHKEGEPVSGVAVDVQITVSEQKTEGKCVSTMEDGSFRIENLRPGHAQVLVGPQCRGMDEDETFATATTTVVAGETTSVDIEIPSTAGHDEGS